MNDGSNENVNAATEESTEEVQENGIQAEVVEAQTVISSDAMETVKKKVLEFAKTIKMGEQGIKELTEAIMGVMETSVFLCKQFSDGFQLGEDFSAIWNKVMNDEAYKQVMKDAYDKFKEIPAECKDIKVLEGIVLAGVVGVYVEEMVNVFLKYRS